MTRWVLIAAMAISCGGDDDDDGAATADAARQVDSSAGSVDAAAGGTVPDPGNGSNAWQAAAECCGTPQTSHAVGTVDANNPYIEGTADVTSGSVFYVFRTAAGFTEFTAELFKAGADITGVHLHDADGLVFGQLVTPSASTETGGTWTVQADHVYVLEVATAAGGFF